MMSKYKLELVPHLDFYVQRAKDKGYRGLAGDTLWALFFCLKCVKKYKLDIFFPLEYGFYYSKCGMVDCREEADTYLWSSRHINL